LVPNVIKKAVLLIFFPFSSFQSFPLISFRLHSLTHSLHSNDYAMNPDDLVAAMDRERDNEDAALYLGRKVSFVHARAFSVFRCRLVTLVLFLLDCRLSECGCHGLQSSRRVRFCRHGRIGVLSRARTGPHPRRGLSAQVDSWGPFGAGGLPPFRSSSSSSSYRSTVSGGRASVRGRKRG
jgi:hypothetical protein